MAKFSKSRKNKPTRKKVPLLLLRKGRNFFPPIVGSLAAPLTGSSLVGGGCEAGRPSDLRQSLTLVGEWVQNRNL